MKIGVYVYFIGETRSGNPKIDDDVDCKVLIVGLKLVDACIPSDMHTTVPCGFTYRLL